MHDRLLPSSYLTKARKLDMSAYRALLVRAGEEELRKLIEERRRQAERNWELVVDATTRLKQLAVCGRSFDEPDPS